MWFPPRMYDVSKVLGDATKDERQGAGRRYLVRASTVWVAP